MVLLYNGNMFASSGVKHFGVTAVNSAYPAVLQSNFVMTGRMRNLTAGEGITSDLVGIPAGYRHPGAWMMPQKPGVIKAENTIIGSGSFAATAQSGYNIDATITGSGTIPGCDVGLIVSIAATLTASGGISSATVDALATMVAALTGSGDVSATAAGLADLGATLLGSGAINANNSALMDIAAEIRGYGAMTPEGIRDTIWNAVLANYPDAGTAGNALTNAGAGGNPWSAIIESGYTAEEILRLIASVLAGKVSGAGTGTETFRDIGDTKDRIVATVDSSGNRTAITRDAT